MTIAGGVVVPSLSWKGEDERGETSLVVVIAEPVGDNIGERGERGSNNNNCGREGCFVVVIIKGGG